MQPLRRQLNKRSLFSLLIPFIVINFGCAMENTKKNYTVDQIKLRVINDSNSSTTYVVFTALMETQFYSTGIKIISEEKNNLVVEFVRTNIKVKDPQFDVKAEFLIPWITNAKISGSVKDEINDQSNPAEQIVQLPKLYEYIFIFDGINKNLAWSKSK
jgi:hypothetical protein